MDLKKIGVFISKCRKEKKLTQEQLASKLNISDRAISKWERGLSLPDASLMIELCEILGINVNELLSGEKIEKDSYDKKAEKLLLEMTEQKEKADKVFLNFEIIVGLITFIFSFLILFIVAYLENTDVIVESTSLLIVIPIIIFMIVMCAVLLRIEQVCGYYECNKCHHKYVPTFNSVFFSMHVNRTRYMKCPKCEKWSWNKKVLKK